MRKFLGCTRLRTLPVGGYNEPAHERPVVHYQAPMKYRATNESYQEVHPHHWINGNPVEFPRQQNQQQQRRR